MLPENGNVRIRVLNAVNKGKAKTINVRKTTELLGR